MCQDCSGYEPSPRDSPSEPGGADDSPSGVNRRATLRRLGAAVTGVAGLSSVTTVSASGRGWFECSDGDWEPGGSWNSIDVEIVDAANSWQYRNAYSKCVDGVCEGLSQLFDECWWFDGYRVTLSRTGKAYTGSRSDSALEDFLDNQGLDEDVHYHIVYASRDLRSKHNGGRNGWDPNSRSISAVSAPSTSVHAPSMHVRGLHQMMHMYIQGKFAKEESGRDDLGAYDATHALGTYDASEGVRSVMADRNEYIGMAESGTCSGNDPYWKKTAPTSVSDIYFSECTKNALRRSAYEAR